MLHAPAYDKDDKARLHETLPLHAKKISKNSNRSGVTMDAFIISATPFDTLRKRYEGEWDRAKFAGKHILFMKEEGDLEYLRAMFGG